MRTERLLAIAVVVVVAILALIAGVIYLTVAGGSLPSVLGVLHGYKGHRTHRGEAALAAGVILLLIAGGLFITGRRAARPRTAG